MTEKEAIKDISENIKPYVGGKSLDMAIKALEEVQMYYDGKLCLVPEDVFGRICEENDEYKEIGTVEECRAAVEKQKEMIAYWDENDCSDCPFHNTNSKYNKCMNDFIVD